MRRAAYAPLQLNTVNRLLAPSETELTAMWYGRTITLRRGLRLKGVGLIWWKQIEGCFSNVIG